MVQIRTPNQISDWLGSSVSVQVDSIRIEFSCVCLPDWSCGILVTEVALAAAMEKECLSGHTPESED